MSRAGVWTLGALAFKIDNRLKDGGNLKENRISYILKSGWDLIDSAENGFKRKF